MLHAACLIVHDHQESLSLFYGDVDTLLETVGRGGRLVRTDGVDGETVDDDLDVMVLVTVDLHATGNLLYLSVYTDMEVSFSSHTLEKLTVMTLTTSYHRGKDENLLPGIVVHDHLDDFLFRVFHHRLPRHITVSLTGTGKEQSHIVIDLRSGTYGRAGVFVGGLLLNTDDG